MSENKYLRSRKASICKAVFFERNGTDSVQLTNLDEHLNPFAPKEPFLYSLKTSENRLQLLASENPDNANQIHDPKQN